VVVVMMQLMGANVGEGCQGNNWQAVALYIFGL
jgi:hypothetical protein